MKLAIIFSLLMVCAAYRATAQTIIPSATKITYATNTVEVADSVAKKASTIRKNDIRVTTIGTGVGSSATLTDKYTGRVIWSGKLSKVRIVGLSSQTDSLKVISLKTTPFN